MPKGGQILVETKNVRIDEVFCKNHPDAKSGDYVQLAVSDTGMGMDDATLDQIFDPFFTTKELGRGTGLGLATVDGIVEQHEGFIRVDTKPGKGTAFFLYFPAADGVAEQAGTMQSSRIRGTETLLLADDHEGLLEVAQEFLGACGYTVIAAKNGEEAVRLFTENKTKVDLVILDVAMPLLMGPEVYHRIRKIKPAVRVIFTTGHAVEWAPLNSTLEHGAELLHKPYGPQELGKLVRRALDTEPSSA